MDVSRRLSAPAYARRVLALRLAAASVRAVSESLASGPAAVADDGQVGHGSVLRETSIPSYN